ncbi:MAG: HAD family hydrolase [Anaerolineales bacterium]|nr:HAD family hydrolase [Anaerolineales bacterium]
MNAFRAVFFDLGKTLMHAKAPWRPILLRSDKALAASLRNNGVSIDISTFPYEFTNRINNYYTERDETLRETSILNLLRHILDEKGFRNVPDPILRAALDAKYAITQRNWGLETDAQPTLHTLKSTGYLLALLSNAGDDPDVQALLDKFELRPYFNFILTSATCGYRKPHPYIFEQALNALKLLPQQTAMVGDTLSADIKGAQALGIHGIWINRRANIHTKTLNAVQPNITVRTLAEIPETLKKIQLP